MATGNNYRVEYLLGALAGLNVGDSITIPADMLGAQWELVITRTGDGRFDLTHRNPAPDGRSKFYEWTTTGNPYGAGMINQEPSLGIPCRKAGIDVDGNLVGVVALDNEGEVRLRASWSKLMWSPKPEERATYGVTPEGEVVIDGKSLGYIHAIFLPDKNRMKGWVAVVRPNLPNGMVKVLEMEQMVLALLD